MTFVWDNPFIDKKKSGKKKMFSLADKTRETNSYNFQENSVQFSPDFGALDDILSLDFAASQIQQCNEDTNVTLDENNNEDPPVVPSASLGIIQNYTRGIKRLFGAAFEPEPRKRLSTEDILRLAGKKFIQTSARLKTLPFIGLSQREIKDVNLVQKLLSAAEKFGQKKYQHAKSFLDECTSSSSDNGNQMERIVYYFSKALNEKIDKETGRVSIKDSLKEQANQIDENLMKASPIVLALHKEIPLSQITLYAGVQVITERVSGAKKVHIIDLEIGSGLHISVLMQALADRVDCPIELIKITAITTKSKLIIEETGKRLGDFAKSINLPFLFNVVMVPDIRELSEELFDLEVNETVVVTALYALRKLIGRQDELEFLMELIKSINPTVMVVTDIEAKHNSPLFVNRFIEAIFYFGAYFDCIEDIKGRDSEMRMQFESIYFGYAIRNIIVGEGDERTYRHVNLAIWRAFFARFDMIEEELSSSSLLQANLVAKTFACWESCTIYKDEKSLMVGWKGMPLQHVSAWRFEQIDPSLVDDDIEVCENSTD